MDDKKLPGDVGKVRSSEGDAVEKLYEDLDRLVESLKLTGEPSLAVSVSETASKALLMAAASNFEAEFSKMFEEVARQLGSPYVANFAMNQGVVRKFHTLFSWDAANANSFFKLFGDEFKERATRRAKEDSEFEASIVEFVRIGQGRNQLIHSDFAAFPLDHTLQELIERYRAARAFLPGVQAILLAGEPETSSDESIDTPRP